MRELDAPHVEADTAATLAAEGPLLSLMAERGLDPTDPAAATVVGAAFARWRDATRRYGLGVDVSAYVLDGPDDEATERALVVDLAVGRRLGLFSIALDPPRVVMALPTTDFARFLP